MLFYVKPGSKKSQPGSKSQPMASRRRCRSATLSRTAGKKGETLDVLGPINLVRRDVARALTFLGGETRKYAEIKAGSILREAEAQRVELSLAPPGGRDSAGGHYRLAAHTQRGEDLFTPHRRRLLRVAVRIRHVDSIHP